jgi:glycosyltransferase involved in cell wall biosynthesis
VKRWLQAAQARGERFDIAHQILPQAMRHASPLRDMAIPYVIGPLGGGLDTPAAFKGEVLQGSSFLSRLRAIDDFRLRHDRALRASYAGADLILGVAPYVAERLAPVGIRRFKAVLERGHGAFPPERTRQEVAGQLRLLHVGRVVRTKGLRDTVRAMAFLRDLPGVTLTSAGDGDDLAACKAEAASLGVADRVTFLGKIPRDRVEEEYAAADVFCFPSFREPMGGVFFEAMAHDLPVITAARGGPDFIIDDSSGLRLPIDTPDQFARDIADAIRRLALEPTLRLSLGRGARARLKSFGSWEDKADAMIGLYHEVQEARAKGAA